MSNREFRVEKLHKQYPNGVEAVAGIDLEVEAGTIFGFLGPNGAGKSTTVKILTTLALPSEGQAWVGGFDVVRQAGKVRQIAGVALQEIGLDPLMTSTEMLILQGELFGFGSQRARQRAKELVQLVGLEEAVDRRIGTYSGGMRRRLDLALALVHQPEILFLDEPTTGLDVASRRDIWQEVRRLNQELGVTIFLTTQYLEEADELADRIAIINRGEIVAQGSPARLKAELGSESINLVFEGKQQAEQALEVLTGFGEDARVDRDVLRIYAEQAAGQIPGVLNQLQAAQLEPISLTLTQPTLDDVFLQYTGESMAAAEAPAA